jgi:hypothetical protein
VPAGPLGLGALGVALTESGWARAAAGVVLALIALKLVFMAVNVLFLGRLLGRRQAAQQAVNRLPPAVARVLRWVVG